MGSKEGQLHTKGRRQCSGRCAWRGEAGGGRQAPETAVERRAAPGPSQSVPRATAQHAVQSGGSGKEAELKAATERAPPCPRRGHSPPPSPHLLLDPGLSLFAPETALTFQRPSPRACRRLAARLGLLGNHR